MRNYLIIFCLLLAFTSFGQTDWKRLEITKFCNFDDRLIESKLIIENAVIRYQDQNNDLKTLEKGQTYISGLSRITMSELIGWKEIANLDTTCGFLIKLDDQYVYVDKDSQNYEDENLKEYIGLLAGIFESIEQ